MKRGMIRRTKRGRKIRLALHNSFGEQGYGIRVQRYRVTILGSGARYYRTGVRF